MALWCRNASIVNFSDPAAKGGYSMMSLFDQAKAMEQYGYEQRAEGFEEGFEKGVLKGALENQKKKRAEAVQ